MRKNFEAKTRLSPIIYDSVTNGYWSFGEKVGQAFSKGKKIN